MGFRPSLIDYDQYPYRTVIRDYIRWNEIENDAGDTVQKIRDFCNAEWANLPATNLAGPWSDVSSAVSSHLHPTTNPAQFFRVKQ